MRAGQFLDSQAPRLIDDSGERRGNHRAGCTGSDPVGDATRAPLLFNYLPTPSARMRSAASAMARQVCADNSSPPRAAASASRRNTDTDALP